MDKVYVIRQYNNRCEESEEIIAIHSTREIAEIELKEMLEEGFALDDVWIDEYKIKSPK